MYTNRIATVFIALIISTTSHSAEEGSSDSMKQSRVDSCKSIVDNNARLKCFDAAVGTPRFAINPSRAPTCYIARNGAPACGPTKKCAPKETGIKAIEGLEDDKFSCYVLGSQPNCCTYCPPEWTGNC